MSLSPGSIRSIRSWLSGIEPETAAAATEARSQSRKRKQGHSSVPSPPSTHVAAGQNKNCATTMAQTPDRLLKRRKVGTEAHGSEDDVLDPEVTPRPAPSFDARSQSSSASNKSGQGSARRQIASLALTDRPLAYRPLNLQNPDLPTALRQLIMELADTLEFGTAIISETIREDLVSAMSSGEPSVPQRLPEQVYGGQVRDSLGSTPLVRSVLNLMTEASNCQETGQAEHGWNCFVHSHVLGMAAFGYPDNRRPRRSVDNETQVTFDPCPW